MDIKKCLKGHGALLIARSDKTEHEELWCPRCNDLYTMDGKPNGHIIQFSIYMRFFFQDNTPYTEMHGEIESWEKDHLQS